jgi:hypothetical protein
MVAEVLSDLDASSRRSASASSMSRAASATICASFVNEEQTRALDVRVAITDRILNLRRVERRLTAVVGYSSDAQQVI